ncbi:AAEL011805-PA, partial [Aedes aegypti]
MSLPTVTECCRCCLVKEDDMICDLIESCGDITVSFCNPYSKHICGNCLNELANATRFRQRCLRTMDVLLNMTIETNEPIKSEIDEYQPHTESEEVEDMRDRFIEELIMEQLNFVCQHCGAGFAMQKNLSKHLLIHRNYASHQLIHAKDHSNSPMDDTEQETKKCQNPKKNHPCSYCGKAFASNSALVAHVRVHTQERPFPCSYCQKRFRTVGALELHERRHSGVHRRIHTKEKPHVCTICNRAFSRVFLLQIHQRTHTGERPFSCEDCGKPFNQQGDLAAHRRTHTGERPHQCDICGKGFIKSSGLTLHRKKHEQQQ